MERTTIFAPEGMVLTNGEVYGREIYLAEGMTEEAYYSITDEEYETLLAAEDAGEEDYLAALQKLGVE